MRELEITPQEEPDAGKMHEQWRQRAVILLDQGGSELTIINFISGQGVSPAVAKPLGSQLYEEARAIVLRKRLPIFIAGWALIAAGVILPVVSFLTTGRFGIAIIMAAPILLGMGLINKARVR